MKLPCLPRPEILFRGAQIVQRNSDSSEELQRGEQDEVLEADRQDEVLEADRQATVPEPDQRDEFPENAVGRVQQKEQSRGDGAHHATALKQRKKRLKERWVFEK